jgi:prophage maintenance system killer protein
LSEKPSPYPTVVRDRALITAANERFSLAAQREVFFSSAGVSDAVRYAVRTGKARQLGPRLYTKNVTSTPEAVCLRNWAEISAGYFPGAIIVGRTAVDFKPAEDGSVFLVAATTRDVHLPGLRLRPRHGPGPLEGDQTFFGHHIYMSSRPRAFLENAQPSRARGGAPSRTLGRSELEEGLERYGRNDPTSLNRLRDDARSIAPQLGLVEELRVLDGLIGTLLGTQNVRLSSARARATANGAPYDPVRIERFEQLATQLLATGLPEVAEDSRHDVSVFAFFESYFSNYIEGTEFTLEEAEDIVFHGAMPQQRPQDAHDILGTYRLVADAHERSRIPGSADELVRILKSQHGTMLAERPEIDPGMWKQVNNHVGGRAFVSPHLVEGTLREVYRFYDSLPPGFARAAFAMFLVAEVHPFADGNGRTARLLMNSELSAAGQQRIVVSTRDRGDYMAALRGMTNDLNTVGYIAVLSGLQQRTGGTDYSSLQASEQDLTSKKAFTDPDERQVFSGFVEVADEL